MKEKRYLMRVMYILKLYQYKCNRTYQQQQQENKTLHKMLQQRNTLYSVPCCVG